jgi:hypothetical protein
MKKLIALAFVLAMTALPSGPAAAYNSNDQAACQDDAFRVCNHAIPDERRVKACLLANMRRLSPQCRRAFSKGRRGELLMSPRIAG